MTSVVVVGPEGGLGSQVRRGLADRGFAAALTDRAGLTTACEASQPLDAVVHAEVDPAALRPRPLVDVDEDEWADLADAPVRATLATLQVARAHLGTGGRIVVVVPSVALVGLPGFVPLCSAGEAQRLLAKSAARAWGADGLRVNVVAADLAALGAAPDDTVAATARGPALAPADTGRDMDGGRSGAGAGDTRDAGVDDLVDAIALLLRPEAARLTGTTLVADGGDLMAP